MPTTVRPEEWIDPDTVFDSGSCYALWEHMFPDYGYFHSWGQAKGTRHCSALQKQEAAARLQQYADAYVVERLKGNL